MVTKKKKTAGQRWQENIEWMTSDLKIRAHVENLPDGQLINLLKLIPVYFETLKARSETIKRNIEAKEYIELIESGSDVDFVVLRRWLDKTIKAFPDDSMIFLAIGSPLPPRGKKA